MANIPIEIWSLIEWYIAFLAAIVIYAFLTNRLRKATLILRCGFADQAEKLLAEKCLPPEKEKGLVFLLDHATDGRIPWVFVFALPIFTIENLFRRKKPDSDVEITNKNIKNKYNITMLLWWLSVLGLSPMAALVLIFEIFVLIIVAHPGRTFSGIVTLILPMNRFLDAHRSHKFTTS
jgi:hypothetical protein